MYENILMVIKIFDMPTKNFLQTSSPLHTHTHNLLSQFPTESTHAAPHLRTYAQNPAVTQALEACSQLNVLTFICIFLNITRVVFPIKIYTLNLIPLKLST